MKIQRLEAHDRLEHLIKDQSQSIQQGAEDCLKKNPLSLAYQRRSPYIYIFAHPRTHDDGLTKVMYWQPRLRKPQAQENSYLFRAISHSDNIEICWMIPPKEMWKQYNKGNVTESDYVRWSIHQYTNNKKGLEEDFPGDFSKERTNSILLDIAREMEEEARMRKLYIKPKNEEALPFSPLT